MDSQIEPSKRIKRVKNNIVGTLEKRRTEKKQMIDEVIVIRGASEEGTTVVDSLRTSFRTTTHMSHTTSIQILLDFYRIHENTGNERELKRRVWCGTKLVFHL